MEIEVIFNSSSGIKKIQNVKAVYTKGGFCCIQVIMPDDEPSMIIKYPLMNIFSVVHPHGDHWGSEKHLNGGKHGTITKSR
jgi:hypothetical protein